VPPPSRSTAPQALLMLLVVVGALSLAADRPSSGVVEALVAPQHPRIAFGAAKKPVAGGDARRSLSASSPAFSAVVPEAVRVADGCAETSSLTTTKGREVRCPSSPGSGARWAPP